MAQPRWRQDELPWDTLDRARVDPECVPLIKAASVVEYNANDYATYLGNIFRDDAGIQTAIWDWAAEEVQHGVALGRWAEAVDPAWSFDRAVERFRAGYTIDVSRTESARGSRSGELISRCMVEIGTSSYYRAIGESVEEPLLRRICRNIESDEIRHYKLFLTEARRYLDDERLPRWKRLWIAVSRVGETEDDELAYAYFAANAPADAVYDRETWNRAYAARAYARYRHSHIERAATLAARACGLPSPSMLSRGAGRVAWWLVAARARRLGGAPVMTVGT